MELEEGEDEELDVYDRSAARKEEQVRIVL